MHTHIQYESGDFNSGSSLKQQSVDFKIFIIVFVARKARRYLSGKRQKKVKEQSHDPIRKS